MSFIEEITAYLYALIELLSMPLYLFFRFLLISVLFQLRFCGFTAAVYFYIVVMLVLTVATFFSEAANP